MVIILFVDKKWFNRKFSLIFRIIFADYSFFFLIICKFEGINWIRKIIAISAYILYVD